jgi:hypothetical protein
MGGEGGDPEGQCAAAGLLQNESANAGYKFGQEEETNNVTTKKHQKPFAKASLNANLA